jgi:glycosidase
MKAKNDLWWKEAVGYQIYPKSFFDSNDDGIGDIAGIIQKIPHLKYLGINLIWICPIYKSPNDDNGYDVSDFYDVNPEFGTLDELKLLIHELHKNDIHIILDLVLNHTSDEHPWFIEAKKNIDSPYHDFYIWTKKKNNLASFFGGPVWEYNEATDEYYMHIFSKKMPDLNWSNPKMREKIYEMTNFYLDLGVDGFRVDAIAHLGRDLTFSDGKLESGQELSSEFTKYSNLPVLHEYLQELNVNTFSKYNAVTIGEVGGGASIDVALLYSGFLRHEIDMVFTFDHCWENGGFAAIYKTNEEIKTNLVSLKAQFKRWQIGIYGKAWNPIYWLNHDHPRLMSQYGNINKHKQSGKMLANVLLFMWGTPFIYNGEEIGMTNINYDDFSLFNDVGVQDIIKNYEKLGLSKEQALVYLNRSSRDNARTPMQWNSAIYGGFSKHKPWIKEVGNHDSINVATQIKDPHSILNYYKACIKLRTDSVYKQTIVYGDFTLLLEDDPNLFVYKRTYQGQTLLVVNNFFDKEIELSLSGTINEILINSYNDYDNKSLNRVLKPYEAFVVNLKEEA